MSGFGDEACPDQDGDVLGDHLLREGEGFSKAVDGGRAVGELVDHGAAGWVGEGCEGGVELIHNLMVVGFAGSVKRMGRVIEKAFVRLRSEEPGLKPHLSPGPIRGAKAPRSSEGRG